MNCIRIWSIIFLTMMSLPMIVACGGDDNENGSSKNVDGVNVTTGKRLSELRFEYGDEYGNVALPLVYKAEYDSKGRINKILFKDIEYKYDKEKKEYIPNYIGEFSAIAIIDYDLRVVKIFDINDSKYSESYGFVLNENGYVSQIGACTLNYDSNGYLVGVERPKGIGDLFYTNNDLVKASLSNLIKGNITLYYVSYGNLENQGDLFLNILRSNMTIHFNKADIAYLIAYQSGLFGKVAKTFIPLNSKSESTVLLDYKDSKYSYSFKMTFICE